MLTNYAQDLETGMADLVSDGSADYAYLLNPGSGQAPLAGYTLSTQRSTTLGTDLLGSVRLVTDPTGATIGAGAYDAWGNARPNPDTSTGSGATLLAGLLGSQPFGYAGQYYDAAAGTYDMRSREYSPTQGQFESVDPQAYDPQVPVTIDPYQYARNVPTDVTDASGQGWAVYSGATTQDEDLIKERIETDFLSHDTTHSSMADVTLPMPDNAGHLVGPAHADLVSMDPMPYQGSVYGEMYDIVNIDYDIGSRLDMNLLGLSAAQRGLSWHRGTECVATPHVSLQRGKSYPLSTGDELSGRRFVFSAFSQLLVSTASDVYLVLASQQLPGIIGYRVCKLVPGAGNACAVPTPGNVAPVSACPLGVSVLACAIDMVAFGGVSECPSSDHWCQGRALLGTLINALPIKVISALSATGKVSLFADSALLDSDTADGVVADLRAETNVIVTSNDRSELLGQAERDELKSSLSKGARLKATSMTREARAVQIVKQDFPGAKILTERYILNSKGKKIIDAADEQGRRLDIVVVQDKQVIAIREVTTPGQAANKNPQLTRTIRIRNAGDVYVRDPQTGKLIPIPPPPESPESLLVLP